MPPWMRSFDCYLYIYLIVCTIILHCGCVWGARFVRGPPFAEDLVGSTPDERVNNSLVFSNQLKLCLRAKYWPIIGVDDTQEPISGYDATFSRSPINSFRTIPTSTFYYHTHPFVRAWNQFAIVNSHHISIQSMVCVCVCGSTKKAKKNIIRNGTEIHK